MTRITQAVQHKEIRAIQKTFDVASSGRLFISVPGADLELTSNDSEEVAVDVYVTALSEHEAQLIIDRIKLRLRAIDRQTVRIEARSFYSDNFAAGWSADESLQIRLVIRLPEQFNVDLQTAGSHTDIEHINGRLTVQSSGGSLHASHLQGRLEVYGYACSINVDTFNGTKLSLQAAASTLSLQHIKATHLSVSASSCTTKLEEIEGQTTLYLHSGNADVKKAAGPLDVKSQGCTSSFFIDQVDDTVLAINGGELSLHMIQKLKAKVILEGPSIDFDEKLSFSGEKLTHRVEGHLNKGKNLLRAYAAAAPIRCLRA